MAFDSSEPSNSQRFSTFVLKNMKKLHKLDVFGFFDELFCHIDLSETGLYPFKMSTTGQRFQLLMNSFRVLTHENVKKITKIALGNQKL